MEKLPKYERRLGPKRDAEVDEPEYTSGKKDNPHASPITRKSKFYDDHGRGKSSEGNYSEEKTITKKIW